jgi:hypothetical protein
MRNFPSGHQRRKKKMSTNTTNFIELAAEIVSAYVSNNSVPASDLPSLIGDVHAALHRITAGPAAPVEVIAEPLKPAVPVKKSVTNEYIICLEDGKKLRLVTRAIPRALGPCSGLSDGCTQLCCRPLAPCQGNGSWPAAPPGPRPIRLWSYPCGERENRGPAARIR